MRRNISDLWGPENQWEKINARKQSQRQYWADFNCDLTPAAVSHMMNGRSPSPLLRESLIWQLSVCPLAFIVASSLYLVSCYRPPNLPASVRFSVSAAFHPHGAALVEIKLTLWKNEIYFSPLLILCCRFFFFLFESTKKRFGLLLRDSFCFCLVFTHEHVLLIRAVE